MDDNICISESYGISDIGLSRLNNEDVWAQIIRKRFFILADGMGGHNAGEIAANETVLELCKSIQDLNFDKKFTKLKKIISFLNKQIVKTNNFIYDMAAQEKELNGMGTTLCCAK